MTETLSMGNTKNTDISRLKYVYLLEELIQMLALLEKQTLLLVHKMS